MLFRCLTEQKGRLKVVLAPSEEDGFTVYVPALKSN